MSPMTSRGTRTLASIIEKSRSTGSAIAHQQCRRDAQPFLEEILVVEIVAAAADVGDMRDAADEAGELSVAEHRRRDRQVGQVAGS